MPATTAKLIVVGTQLTSHEIVLNEFPVRLGRRLGNDIQLDDRWVSRDHCEISRETGDELTVRDLGSKHGTYVNSREVTVASLHTGDELRVGLTRFIVRCVGEPAAIAAVPHPAAI